MRVSISGKAPGGLPCFSTALLALLLLGGSVLTWATTKGPDKGNYTGTDQAVYSFIDVSGVGGGTSVLAGIDDGSVALTLPFAFQFYGHSYTVVCVSSNGALYFVSSAHACSGFNDFANLDLTVAGPPNDLPALLPFWRDLTFQVPGAGSVYYQTIGAAPSRKFVVQWSNAYPQGSPTPVTFEVVLQEGTNQVMFQYQSVVLGQGSPEDRGGKATVGIRNSGAVSSGEQIAWSYAAKVLDNSTALLFNPTSPPTIAAAASPNPNFAGWNNSDVNVTLTASGTAVSIQYTLTGAQNASATVNGTSATVTISAEGQTTLTAKAGNAGGFSSPVTLTVKIDKAPPTVVCSATPSSLWPPNNNLVNVATDVSVTDTLSGAAGFVLQSVTSNEPGSGEIAGWAIGTPSLSGQLQAARSGNGNGRVYTLTYSGSDKAGNSAVCVATVTVPHDEGK